MGTESHLDPTQIKGESEEYGNEYIRMQWTEQGAMAFGREPLVVSIQLEYIHHHVPCTFRQWA